VASSGPARKVADARLTGLGLDLPAGRSLTRDVLQPFRHEVVEVQLSLLLSQREPGSHRILVVEASPGDRPCTTLAPGTFEIVAQCLIEIFGFGA
jgi:hypothetical protein